MTFDFVYHGNMLSKHHPDSPPLAKASRWNLSKFVVIKHFGWESLNVQPSCCLDVVVYMLNCVFWRHILLEIEFKSRVDMGSDSSRYTVQRYHPWALHQLSTPKKNPRNGGILRLRLAYGRRSNKTPAQAFTPPADEKKMGTIWIFVYYAVYGSDRGRCRDFLVLK